MCVCVVREAGWKRVYIYFILTVLSSDACEQISIELLSLLSQSSEAVLEKPHEQKKLGWVLIIRI